MKTYTGIRQLVRVFRTLGWVILAGSILFACAAIAIPLLGFSDALPTSARILLSASFGGLLGFSFVAAGIAYSSILFFSAAILELLLDIQANTFEGKMFLHRALTKSPPKKTKEALR